MNENWIRIDYRGLTLIWARVQASIAVFCRLCIIVIFTYFVLVFDSLIFVWNRIGSYICTSPCVYCCVISSIALLISPYVLFLSLLLFFIPLYVSFKGFQSPIILHSAVYCWVMPSIALLIYWWFYFYFLYLFLLFRITFVFMSVIEFCRLLFSLFNVVLFLFRLVFVFV